MMAEDPRTSYRAVIVAAWQKHRQQQALSALEQQLVALIQQHPEYIPLLEQTTALPNFEPADNPFLHLSLHLSLHEQLQLDRPPGIRRVYQQLLQRGAPAHVVEHQLMEVLASVLWHAQQSGQPPEEQDYLRQLQALLQAQG